MKRNLTLLCLSAFILTANAQDINDNLFDKRYIKTIMIKTANWQLHHPKHEPRDWTNGAFYAGLYACLLYTSRCV